jgi:hypothetical protein
MKFPDAFLDELRARVPVSEIVGRKFKLRKEGHEFRAVDDKSLTVNDQKGLWWDHAKSEGGDAFEFLTKIEGLTFPEAVKTCASIAGLQIPGAAVNGSAQGVAAQVLTEDGPPPWGEDPGTSADSAPRKIARTYDYTDEAGSLIYQVVRYEPKEFRQRRPDGKGGWIWSIKDIQPLFYRLPEVLEALAEERPVFITEGEKDADTLWEWGVPATTNSGGAKHWGRQDLSIFKDADIIVALDNDDAGRARASVIGESLKTIVKRIRVLDFANVWARAPKGADVTDWRDHASGTVEQLYEIAKALPDWKPVSTHSKFGRIRWQDQEQPNLVEYEWWIKGLIPKRETIAVVGATQTGKSFETFNLGMHIARGIDYRGCRTKQGLVIYCAMEGGKGFRDRLRGYRMQHGLPLEGIPFEVLTRRADLFSNDTDLKELIIEIKAIAAEHIHPLAVVVIDTYSAATPGLKENTSEDISRVRQRVVAIQDACNCGVLFVDHTNAVGDKVRGHTSKTADIETQLDVAWVTRRDGRDLVPVLDQNKRKIRRLTVFKQREGEAGQHWDFILKAVEVRKDADGDRVTTCVSEIPELGDHDTSRENKRTREGPKGEGFNLYREGEAAVFKAIIAALETKGEPPPPELRLPSSIGRVVRWSEVGIAYKTKVPNDDGDTDHGKRKYAERVKKTLKRAREALLGFSVIGIDQIAGDDSYHVVWPTGKAVWGPDLRWPNGHKEPVEDKPKDTDQTSLSDFY